MKRNSYVIPVVAATGPGTHHLTLSVRGMFKLAEAIQYDDPETAQALRDEATARGIAAIQRLNPEMSINE